MTRFDVLLFNSALVAATASRDSSTELLSYRASLLTRLCADDVELGTLIHETTEDGRASVTLDQIMELGGPRLSPLDCSDDVTHPPVANATERRKILRRRVWEAQVEVLFAVIERKRIGIITQIADDLCACLKEHDVVQNHEVIDSPMDVELGTLVYLMASGWLVVGYDLKSRIHLLRRIRNDIAHGSMCSDDDVQSLLNVSQGHRS